MIHEIKTYGATCDNCGESWRDDHTGFVGFTTAWDMSTTLAESEWHIENEKTYCHDCYYFDEDDNLVLKEGGE